MSKSILRLFVLLAMTFTLFAAPGTITFQGKLLDGSSLANGSYDFKVAIFDLATNGTQLWPSVTGTYEEHLSVAVTGGLYSIQLGTTVPLSDPSILNNGFAYLDIMVKLHSASTYTSLMPRTQLNSVPYALQAQSVYGGTATVNSLTIGTPITSSPVNIYGNGTVPLVYIQEDGATSALSVTGGVYVSDNFSLTDPMVWIQQSAGGAASAGLQVDADVAVAGAFGNNSTASTVTIHQGGTGRALDVTGTAHFTGNVKLDGTPTATDAVTKGYVDGALSTLSGSLTGYVMTPTLNNYVTNSSLTSTLTAYATEVYVDNAIATAIVGGFVTNNLSNLALTTAINSSLLPGATNSIDLGSTAKMWKNLYASAANFEGNSTSDATITIIQDDASASQAFALDVAGLANFSDNGSTSSTSSLLTINQSSSSAAAKILDIQGYNGIGGSFVTTTGSALLASNNSTTNATVSILQNNASASQAFALDVQGFANFSDNGTTSANTSILTINQNSSSTSAKVLDVQGYNGIGGSFQTNGSNPTIELNNTGSTGGLALKVEDGGGAVKLSYHAYTGQTSAFTIANNVSVVYITATGGAPYTITLPTSAVNGTMLYVKLVNTSGGNITIGGNVVADANNKSFTFVFIGGSWQTVSMF